ncbi:MAG TPA: universal stress protein [Bryobacteraceae bacterium]|nr:universal stress protein [Bryobacteraceae bacterium]
MLKLERILCPVDFSEFSAKAYDYAHSLARHYGAKLFVLHVTEPIISIYRGYMSAAMVDEIYTRQTADTQEKVRKLSERHQGGQVESDVVVQLGIVSDSILTLAETQEIDLIVMGTHGRRGIDRLAMGSNTERVLRKALCPVLAVREPVRDFVSSASAVEPVQLRKIVCCTDFSDNSPRALEYAFSLAAQYEAEVTLLHVLEDSGAGPRLEEQKEQAFKRLEEVIPSEAQNWATVIPLVRAGKPYEEIMEHAAQTQADLIVMGVRGRNALDVALFGSTTHRVIQLGPCPVLVVRT